MEMSTAPVLLKESGIPEACLAERKPADMRKANLFLLHLFRCDRESTACKTMICFLMFSSNYADPLSAIISVNKYQA